MMSVPLSGGTPVTLAPLGGTYLYGLAFDATSLYWLTLTSPSGPTTLMKLAPK